MRRYSAWALVALLTAACGYGAGDEATADADDAAGEDAATIEMTAVESGMSCNASEDTDARPSPLHEVSFTYEGGEGMLCYGAPSAREREVMGGLVPYGAPWRLGANEATALHLSAATMVGGVSVDAGSYSLYAIPGEMEWEFVLNSNHERWGIPINDDIRSTDVGSFTVSSAATGAMVEMLTFEHMDGMLRMSWENTQVDISIGM